MFTDIHAHILCGVDDGPENFEQSALLLDAAVKDGVKRVVVTPHFFPTLHSLSEQVKIVDRGFLRLKRYTKQKNIPITLLRGFEVRYFSGISRIDALHKLCINNSKVLLLELPPMPITDQMIDEILRICYLGYIVILAHIERYVKIPGFKKLKQHIVDGDILAQCNADSFVKHKTQRIAFKLLKENMVDLIASDMHSVDKRPPCLKKAYEIIEKKAGAEVKHQLILNSKKIFSKCL